MLCVGCCRNGWADGGRLGEMFMLGTTVLRENKLREVVPTLLRIHFLGHVTSDEGIVVDPMKVEAIRKWHVPMNVPKVRNFVGLAGYYQ
jgi:hypothetical protein